MIAKAAFRLVSEVARLVRDRNGQVVIYFTILAPVMLGLIGLSLEGGRLLMLNSQLQDLADAAALAGAKELDGGNAAGNDAITRAINAAENVNVLNNTCTTQNDFQRCWSTDNSFGVQIVDPPIFYSALKGQPTDNPAANDVPTTDPTLASYIKVTTVTRQLTPAFLVAVGATSIAQTSATATAGSTYVACNVQPLMLCNPNEPNDFTATAGQLFGFTPVGGGNQQLSPGDFSLLDPSGTTNSGGTAIRNLLSQTVPNFCYADNVSPRPGQVSGDVADGINVRFDMQPQGGANHLAGLDQTPAPDVIKGMKLNNYNNCNWSNPPQLANAQLPGNTDMTQSGSLLTGSTMDMAAANTYWNYHHGANWPANITTRYAAYQLERGITAPAWLNNTEVAAPQCAPAGVRNAGDDSRRMISVAIVNCQANNIKGNSVASVRSNLYADFFLTVPVFSGSVVAPADYQQNVIYAEFVRKFTPQTDGSKLHQIIQLYRDQ
jgi:Flp pilus assembly protein TadG